MTSSSINRVERKTFAARADLLDRLSEVASKRGYSLYSLVNDIFEAFLSVDEAGVRFEEVLEGYKVLKRARECGFVLQLESLLYEMVDLAYRSAGSEVLKRWFEAGAWFAKRWFAKKREGELWRELSRELKSLLWNIEEVEVEVLGERVSISIFSPRFSEPYTISLASFLEGCLSALNYKVTSKEVLRGKIFVEACKVG